MEILKEGNNLKAENNIKKSLNTPSKKPARWKNFKEVKRTVSL